MAEHDTRKRTGAKELRIDLSSNDDGETFRWLVACLLFAARINSEIAARAFTALDRAKIVTPRKLAKADRQRLVDILGGAGYRRYDETKARELVQLGTDVVQRYRGRVTRLLDGVEDAQQVRQRLQEFAGIGPTATDIFLRDVGSAWRV